MAPDLAPAPASDTILIGAGARDAGLQHLRQHLLLRTEGLHAAVLQHQDLVDRLDADRPVRDHDHDGAALAGGAHRAAQRLVAFGIEIGIGLVEHDQEGIAVQRAGQRHALRLARRQRGALLADLGVVAVAHLDDHVVHAGFLGGGDDLVGFGVGIEAADVLRHGACEQLDVLRQVADELAEHVGRPLVQRRAVDADLAAERLPDADQRADQRRLAGAGGSDHAEAVAGLQRKGHVRNDHALIAGRGDDHALDRETARWVLQQRLRRPFRHFLQQAVEAMPALPCGDETLPVRDREIDRRQRARGQDRARDDDAGGRLLVDHEIGADAEHRGLQHHPHHLGHGAEAAGDVARVLVAGEIFFVGFVPALVEPARHAHRDQHLGIAAACGGEIVAPRGQGHRLARRLARHVFGDQRQPHQEDGADQRGDADHDVEGEADREIERQPWQVEEGARPHAAEERTDIVEIAQRLQPFAASAAHQRQSHHDVEHARVQGLVERGADAAEDAAAQQIEEALRHVEAGGDHDEADQRRHAAARQHAVIDLEHEDRAGQIQQVDDAAHHEHADERAATGAQRFTEFGTPDTGSGRHQS